MIEASGKLHVRCCCSVVDILCVVRLDPPPQTLNQPPKTNNQTLDRLLPKLKAAGHRVVIFSQWTHLLDILDDYLFLRGVRAVLVLVSVVPTVCWLGG